MSLYTASINGPEGPTSLAMGGSPWNGIWNRVSHKPRRPGGADVIRNRHYAGPSGALHRTVGITNHGFPPVATNAGPFGAFPFACVKSMGFRPWLTMSGPSGRTNNLTGI